MTELLNQALQLNLPINKFIGNKVRSAIKNLNLRKAPNYDLITAQKNERIVRRRHFFFNAIVQRYRMEGIRSAIKSGQNYYDT